MKRKITHSFLTASLLFFTLLGGTPAFADTRYVDAATGNNANSGTVWNQAYKTLAHAIREAHQTLSITEIRVAKGIYYPEDKAGNGTSDRHKAFTITRKGLELLGGYPTGGNGSRDPDANPTIMSGDLGELGNYTDNAYHVLITVGAHIDASLKLDGFTIRDGNANGASGDRINVNGYDLIQDARCAGWFNVHGSPVLNGMKIINNRSNQWGGGVLNVGGSPTVTNARISENSADIGGGWLNNGGNPILKNVEIRGNSAYLGGGWYSFGGNPVMQNSLITENSAELGATAWGHKEGSMTLLNCTVAGNIGPYSINLESGSIDIRNSIIWGSSDKDFANLPGISYTNCIARGSKSSVNWNESPGNKGGNLDIDPLFVNPAAGDYRLQFCSPAINRGKTSLITDQSFPDLAGNARVIGSNVDIGAYEYQGSHPGPGTIYVDASVTATGNGASWATAFRSLAEAIKLAHESCFGIDKILVAEGTYYPEYKAGNGTSDRHKAFTITRKGLELLGGYPAGGNGTRDPDAHPTIMSGNLGALNNNADNAYHVLITVGSDIDASLKLDGFTVRDGNADGGWKDFISVNDFASVGNSRCGGWYNVHGSPQLNKMKITNNSSYEYGGGVLNEGGSPTVTNTIISDNMAERGGGWYNYPGNPILKNVVISGNFASDQGGGWYNNGGNPVIQNALIIGNTNGALNNKGASGNPSLLNCTIVGNVGSGNYFQYTSIANSILWDLNNNYGGTPSNNSYTNSILRGSGGSSHWMGPVGSDKGGNLDINPLFVNPAAGDYRLQPCSPAIEAGKTSLITDQTVPDLAGNTRVIGANVDMGAFESVVAFSGVIYIKAGGTGNGTSWDCAMGDLQAAINLSSGGQQVWVAKGTYKRPNSGEYFRMKDNVKIYGGFNGDETSLTQRDLTNTLNASILQGHDTHVVYNNGENVQSSALLDGFTITGGGGNLGGGIRNHGASPTIKNCVITGNTVGYQGAGIFNFAFSSPTFINCIIRDNRTSVGGASYNSNSSPRFINCIISNNTAENGAGIYSLSSTVTVINCTIAGNGTSAISSTVSTVLVRNSIVYGNGSGINAGDVQYSLVQGMTGTDNHNLPGDTDPLFVDAASGNYRLQTCSPVINRGNNGYYATGQDPDLSAITTDLDGKARFYNDRIVDLGAYEQEYSTAIIYVREGGRGPGTSWACATGDLQAAIKSANSGDQVWVAGGTYQGSFSMSEGVKIYGGFKGDEESRTERDLRNTAYSSTLNGGGTHYVVYNERNNLTFQSVLDGFTITDGYKSGIYNWSASPSIVNCIIKGNSAGNNGEYGGGIYNQESSPFITNCLIIGNRGRYGGGGIANINYSSPTLTNCTIAGNWAAGNSGGIYNETESWPVVRNSIVYGNSGGINSDNGSGYESYHNLIQGVTDTSDGNIADYADPLFTDAANGNYRLQACSPAINRGNDDYYREIRGQRPDLSYITTDLAGEVRIYNGTVDIGAYEFTGTPIAPVLAANKGEFIGQISGNTLLGVDGSVCTVIARLIPNGAFAVSGEVTAKVWVETNQPQNFLKRHYQITPATNAQGATAQLTLYFTQQEFDDFNAVNPIKLPLNALDAENYKANLRIEKRSGTSNDGSGLPASYNGTVVTINPLNSSLNGSIAWNNYASRWEVSFDVTGFSGFFVKTTETPLPLKLLSFTVTEEKGANLLNWKTASEVNTLNFEVQRSADAKTFTQIGTVNAHGNGNHQYSYQDAKSYYGNVYYRLKMNDIDGSFAYSKIISVTNGEASQARVYPNPAIELIDLKVPQTLIQSEATLYDVTGRPLQSITITANMQQVSIKSLLSGVYILKFADGTAERFVKE